MTTIGSTADTTATKTAADANATPSLGLNADFNLFLKLLTASMQNQDPLDPMDTSEYTQQLVQYSQVEQSIKSNTTLSTMLERMGTSDFTNAATMIGKNVQFGSDMSGLTADTPAQWEWASSGKVASMTATITDAKGNVVATKDINADTTTGSFSWDGTLDKGGKAPDGTYTVAFAGKDASGNDLKIGASAVGKVSDVQMFNGGVYLTVNGAQVPLNMLEKIS